MKVRFIRMWGGHASGRTADLTPEEYRQAYKHCVPLPDENARAEPDGARKDETRKAKNQKGGIDNA